MNIDNEQPNRPGRQAREERRAKQRNMNETNATPHEPEFANFDDQYATNLPSGKKLIGPGDCQLEDLSVSNDKMDLNDL